MPVRPCPTTVAVELLAITVAAHIRPCFAKTLQSKRLGAGVIDGRGAWADDGTALRLLCALRARLGAGQPISVQVRPPFWLPHPLYAALLCCSCL